MYTGNKMCCDPRCQIQKIKNDFFINKEKITASSKYSGTSIQKKKYVYKCDKPSCQQDPVHKMLAQWG